MYSSLRHSDKARGGFTLLELMVVMSILAAMTMMVTPVFSDSLRNFRQENAARDFFAALNYAHNRALTESVPYRVYLSMETNSYWIEKETLLDEGEIDFYPLEPNEFREGTFGDKLILDKPDARYDRLAKMYYVNFFPTGMCDAVEITLSRAEASRERYTVISDGNKIRMYTPEGDAL